MHITHSFCSHSLSHLRSGSTQSKSLPDYGKLEVSTQIFSISPNQDCFRCNVKLIIGEADSSWVNFQNIESHYFTNFLNHSPIMSLFEKISQPLINHISTNFFNFNAKYCQSSYLFWLPKYLVSKNLSKIFFKLIKTNNLIGEIWRQN